MAEAAGLRARYEKLLRALVPMQQRFVEEYLVDLCQTDAAIRAGYSERSARAKGSQLYALPHVRAAIDAGKELRAERTEITQDYVLLGLKEVAERCLQRAPVMVGRGEDRTQAVDEEGRNVWTFDASGANKAFELLGKHLGIFNDKMKVEHSGVDGAPLVPVVNVNITRP